MSLVFTILWICGERNNKLNSVDTFPDDNIRISWCQAQPTRHPVIYSRPAWSSSKIIVYTPDGGGSPKFAGTRWHHVATWWAWRDNWNVKDYHGHLNASALVQPNWSPPTHRSYSFNRHLMNQIIANLNANSLRFPFMLKIDLYEGGCSIALNWTSNYAAMSRPMRQKWPRGIA